MTLLRKLLPAAVAAPLLAALVPSSAEATPSPYCLNPSSEWGTTCDVRFDVGNSTLQNGGFVGPYVLGTIDLLAPNSAKFTFNSQTQVVGGTTYTYKFGDMWMNLAGYNGSNLAVSDLSYSGNIFPTTFAVDADGSGNVSEFGNFNIGVDDKNGAKKAVSFIQFTLTFIDAATWSSAATILELNDKGASGAGHIYVFAQGANYATVTGFAGWPCANEPTCGPVTEVPAPGALPLLGLGLLGIGAISRRRRN